MIQERAVGIRRNGSLISRWRVLAGLITQRPLLDELMIIDPDFLDHWRTLMLIDTLKNEMAPFYIIRIWSHCQQRKAWSFELPAAGLKALCHAKEAADDVEKALIEAGFITRNENYIEIPKWADKNASLIAAWKNGDKGGRPLKNNPIETHGLGNHNPGVTHGEPRHNPGVTEERRGEEIGEEKASVGKPTVDKPAKSKPVFPDCPYSEIIELYHQTLPTLPQMIVVNPTRESHIKARWRDFYAQGDFKDKEGGLECFRWLFADKVGKSKFLMGYVNGGGRKPFVATLDWIVNSNNFAKIIEGKYE